MPAIKDEAGVYVQQLLNLLLQSQNYAEKKGEANCFFRTSPITFDEFQELPTVSPGSSKAWVFLLLNSTTF